MILSESLSYRHNTKVEKAYIITLENNELSRRLSTKCLESCIDVDMPYEVWPAVDGTSGVIIIPDRFKELSYLKWIKKTNPILATSEICVVLSHLTLWARCVEIDQPIVILEHDAVMTRQFSEHPAFNNIIYLGAIEQVQNGNYWNPIPLHGQLNPNYRFICRTHAYSVDPMAARQLLAHVIKYGISSSIDVFMRADIFPMMQVGIFAHDEAEESTTPEKTDKLSDQKLMKIHNKIYL